jgi:hypothetical protein
MRRFAHIDFLSGVLLIGVGLFFAIYGGANYQFGELRRMGPGFFPVVLGYVLSGLGVVLLISSFTGPLERLGEINWRSFFAVLAGLVAFAFLADKVGMVPSALVMTFVVAFGERNYRWVRTTVLAVVLAVIGVLIFTWGLGLPIPAFRWTL